MTPQEMTSRLDKMEKALLKSKTDSITVKYEVVGMFRYLKKLIKYQIPTPPIDVSSEGHKFTCPTCRTIFDSEDNVEDFNLCYICGQRWKEDESNE